MLSLPVNPLDRAERFARVRSYLVALGLKHYRAIVFGSVGRGDFTADSDTDVLVISDDLPEQMRTRLDLLFGARDVAPEVEPVGWRESDWRRREAEGNPFIAVLKREGMEVREP
jgi:predicted nucleotidyltransferase